MFLESMATPVVTYPRLIKRVRAVLIDSIVVPVAVFLTLFVGISLGVSHVYGKALLVIVPIIILEPMLVAISGGTVGHHLMKLRVAKQSGSGNINIIAATLRFALKILLGWLSFIFVLTTTKHQAAHDLIAGSIVIHKDPSNLPLHEVLSERSQTSDEFVYPPRWRRIFLIAGYWLVATIAFGAASYVISSSECTLGTRCTSADYFGQLFLEITWLIGLGWITIRGWTGRLLGCRRRNRDA
jgi:uncharacterized RDD family membrane protein YckC